MESLEKWVLQKLLFFCFSVYLFICLLMSTDIPRCSLHSCLLAVSLVERKADPTNCFSLKARMNSIALLKNAVYAVEGT